MARSTNTLLLLLLLVCAAAHFGAADGTRPFITKLSLVGAGALHELFHFPLIRYSQLRVIEPHTVVRTTDRPPADISAEYVAHSRSAICFGLTASAVRIVA